MAEPIVRLEPTRISVEPGGTATAVVTVQNPGTVVEGYDVDVVSTVPMPWATVSPATLSVYPQQDATAVVTFAPPRGHQTPGGSFPFGVRLRSQVDADRSAVAEGDLDIGAVSGLQASLVPVTSAGRWRGAHTLQVENWGNSAARLAVTASDPDQALGFLVTPSVLDVPLGGRAYARVKVRTRHPVLRGTVQRLPFQVACEPETGPDVGGPVVPASTPDRPVVDGAFSQKPILTRWVVLGAGLLLLAAGGAVALLANRPEQAVGADNVTVATRPAGVTATAPGPQVVLLTWKAQQAVDKYLVVQTQPVQAQQEVQALTAAGDPTHFLVRLKAETADRYCYRLRAVRGDKTSAPSTPEQCATTTLPPGATPSASPTAIVPMGGAPGETPVNPGGGSTTTSPSAGSSTSTSTSPSGSSPASPSASASTDTPQPWISVLKFYAGEGIPPAPPSGAVDAQKKLAQAGVPARLLYTGDWQLNPPWSGQPGWVLYVDAATPDALQGVCDTIVADHPEVLSANQCAAFGIRQVTSGLSPTVTPTPTPTTSDVTTPAAASTATP